MAKRTNAERCREQYAKHREKRLAAKREEYRADPEKMRARNRANYAKAKEIRVEKARQYRRDNREGVNAKAVDKYHRNADRINQRRAELRQRPEHREKAYARTRKWLEQHPESAERQHAKRLLNEQTGVPIRDIPDELAEAKVEQLKISRWVREQKQEGMQ
jgi:hypothetical protein